MNAAERATAAVRAWLPAGVGCHPKDFPQLVEGITQAIRAAETEMRERCAQVAEEISNRDCGIACTGNEIPGAIRGLKS